MGLFLPFEILTDDGERKGLPVRCSLKDETDVANDFLLTAVRTRLQSLTNVAGHRWAIEVYFEQPKRETRLDEKEVYSGPASIATHHAVDLDACDTTASQLEDRTKHTPGDATSGTEGRQS